MAVAPDAAAGLLVASAEAARDTLSAHMGARGAEALPLVQALLSEWAGCGWRSAAGVGKSASDLVFLVPWVAAGWPARSAATARSVGLPVLLILARRPLRASRRSPSGRAPRVAVRSAAAPVRRLGRLAGPVTRSVTAPASARPRPAWGRLLAATGATGSRQASSTSSSEVVAPGVLDRRRAAGSPGPA